MSRENLLIIGATNSGKSALANVICENDHFEENERTVRNSKDFQEYDINWKGKIYHVVDIKIKLVEREILNKIGQVICSMPEGISQILFVVDQRLTAEEIEKLSGIEEEILKIKIYKNITIVRTKFKDFKSKEECKKDEEDLRSLNKKIFKKLFNKPRMYIVHVDNPPTHIYVGDSDDDGTIRNNSRRREKSRTILLEHLNKVCSKKYKLSMWDKLYESDKSKNNLEERVKSHLKSYDPLVAKIIKKLDSGI
ncbi:unnamed protein product [Rhizophagus irregularis]|nr:unnamed protein product [Rhizophagus irregularis]CAB5314529.1 unnamed protein product [Rhizophagus irregularis]